MPVFLCSTFPYTEDVAAETDLNVVMTAAGQLIEIQGTAEKEPFTRQQLSQLLDLAEKGHCTGIAQLQTNIDSQGL